MVDPEAVRRRRESHRGRGVEPDPEDYPSTFSALASLGVIDDGLAGRLRRAAGLRNVLVDGYVDVDPEILWGSLEGLDDLTTFAARVESFLEA